MANERPAQASDIKLLISKGLEQGYLTYAEVNDHLPDDMVDPEQIEDIIGMINGMGIAVHEVAPDAETLLLAGEASGNREVDETAAEEAAAALTSLDTEGGRTTDPVRMYMREMGTVELLTREGEIAIAKRIEEGLGQVQASLGLLPSIVAVVLEDYELHKAGKKRLAEVIVGFNDQVEEPEPPAVAEPVVYMIDQHVVGGFYRVHTGRGADENLNAPGMHFEPLAFVEPCNTPDCGQAPDAAPNRFYAYGVVARLALLAAAREMAAHG